jgi:predicted small lipoprotein YifL
MLIIAMFLLGLSGCGYKANPYYLENAPEADENVEFKIKKDESIR